MAASKVPWPKDTQAARNAFYGNPGKGEISAQMVSVVPPFAMYYEGKRIANIKFHKKAAASLLAALNEIWDACGRDQRKVDAFGLSKFDGAYNHRMVRGSSTKWSNHAYACAIDLNAEKNGFNTGRGTMPQFAIDAFCRQGWMWGGWYSGRTDPMHFEAVDNGGRQPSMPPPVFDGTAPAAPAPVEAAPVVPAPGLPVLRFGGSGDAVKTLQTKLGIAADGNFGPKTQAALRQYQADHGLAVDGVCGPATWASFK